MIAKSLIAAAALATTMAVALPAQQAQAGVDIDIGVGFGGFYPGYYPDYGYGYGYGGGYGHHAISCRKGARIVDSSGFNHVRAVDCSLPGYKYTAWRHGRKFIVRVNGNGHITGAHRI